MLEIVLFGCGHKVVRSDATLSEDLPAAIGELHFGLLGPLRIVVIIVERNVFVIALNQAAAGGVITRSGEQQSSVFAERKLGLHQAFAEASFADHQAAVMILYGARNDFGSGGALPVDQHHHGNFDSLVSAHGVVAALRGRTAAMRNHDFVFVEEHIGEAYGLIQQSAAIIAQIKDEAVELGEIELLERFGHIAIGGFAERYQSARNRCRA